MKNANLFIVVALLFCSSCELLLFDEVPGKELKTIPKELQGAYIYFWAYYEDGKWNYEDTSACVINETSLNDFDKPATTLTDSSILSKHGKYYFWTTKAGNYWECNIIAPNDEGFITVPYIIQFGDDNDNTVFRNYFSEITDLTEDADSDFLVATNEKEMIKYFEEHLKDSFYLKFVRK